jgi:hypothetical protein
LLVAVNRDLQCALRPLARRELDVGWGEQLAGLDECVDIDASEDPGGDVAPPDRRASSSIGGADGVLVLTSRA